jgi:NAD(P)H-flavin reductase
MLAPERQAAGPGLVPEPFRLLEKRQDAADTWTLALEATSGRAFPFAPGQFTMISRGGSGEVPISISGDPQQPGRLVQTVREVGLATAALVGTPPGGVLGVRGPFGRGWPLESAEGDDVVIAAGGIGLPPLRGAILELLARRERYRRLILLYGGRSPDQLLFVDELERWAGEGLEVFTTVDTAGPEWLGHIGVVTRLVRLAKLDGPRTHAMSCGPEVMMRFVVAELEGRGVASERIHVSIERNMQCGVGHCGHCQLGPTLICRDGPVYPWSEIGGWLAVRGL